MDALEEIALAMAPDDGCLDVCDTGDDIGIVAFTPDGIEHLVAPHGERRRQRRTR